MSTNVLVTGGAGYIGSHTCKALARAGFHPITFDNLVHGHRESIRWGPFVEGDLADKDLITSVLAKHGVDAVIHFAAYAYVGESVQDPGKYFRNNISNTLNLLDAMQEVGTRKIVFSSTCATYGLPESVPINENTPQRPVNPYGESKLFIERALYWHGVAHGLRSVALRYFNAAGADPDEEIGENHSPETHLIPLLIQSALGEHQFVEIYGTDYPTDDGTAVRDYIHVCDLAAAHVAALNYLDDGGSTTALNLGTGRGHSVQDVIAAVESVADCPIPIRHGPRRPGDPPVLVADATLARQVLGWQPEFSDLQVIVESAWRWHLARHQATNARQSLQR